MMVLRKEEGQGSPSLWPDRIKWAIAIILLLVTLAGNYYYSALSLPIRLLASLAIFGVAVGILALTAQGKQAIEFIREARIELRKLVWPTRQETMQTTLVVGLMVVVLALFLWGVDGILLWVIGWLTGQRG